MSGQGVVSIHVPVAWGEQDAFGHVNNVVFFRYFENVRMHFLERIGALRSHREQGIGVILATTTCQFEQPVHWPVDLTISTWCTHIGTTSFTLAYAIRTATGTVVATGTSVQVAYDYIHGHKVSIPVDQRNAIGSLMGQG